MNSINKKTADISLTNPLSTQTYKSIIINYFNYGLYINLPDKKEKT